MDPSQISHIRLHTQQVTATKFTSPKDLVYWMGAMQAQDYAMVKWAIGARLPNVTEKDVEKALDSGDILRTHVLRPTWHLVTAEDIRWMTALTAPHIKPLANSRHRDLGLTEEIFRKSGKVLEKTLRDGNHSTRDELIAKLNQAGIKTDENRASHIFVRLELNGLICSGVSKHGKQTFALLDERVSQSKPLSRDEALSALAQRYFSSHCPAMLDDFSWWSGLSKTDAKRALDMAGSNFISETIESKTYWFSEEFSKVKPKETAYLLPAFDEFIISYKDRSATVTFDNHKRAVSINGIFNPVIVVNGETIGIWKRTFKKDTVAIETEYFAKPTSAAKKMISQRMEQYAKFLGKKLEGKPTLIFLS
jgi:hypothetical protein